MRCVTKNVVKRNVTFIYQNQYDKVKIEYGNIVNKYVIPKGINATVNDVLNVYSKNTVPNLVARNKCERKTHMLLSENVTFSKRKLQGKKEKPLKKLIKLRV